MTSEATDRVMAVLVALDHADDWMLGFGATVDELDPREFNTLRDIAEEIIAAVHGHEGR